MASSIRRVQKTLYALFYEINSRWFHLANDVFAGAALISVLVYVLTTTPSFAPYHVYFSIVEWGVLFVFLFEYVGRVLAHGRHYRSYVLSIYGTADLLATLPLFFGTGSLSFLKATRVMRMMRFFRFAHVHHLVRIPRHFHSDLEDHHHRFKYHLGAYFAALVTIVSVLGVAFYRSGSVYGVGGEVVGMGTYFFWFVLGAVPYVGATVWHDMMLVGVRLFSLLFFALCISLAITWVRKPHTIPIRYRIKPHWW